MASDSAAPDDVEGLAARLRALALRRPDAWLHLDITLPQLRALYTVREHQPLTVSRLAALLDQRVAAVSAMTTRLVRADLLRRSEDPGDRRRVLLELTATAERHLGGIDERAAARYTALLARMSPRGRRALATALDELVDLLSQDGGADRIGDVNRKS